MKCIVKDCANHSHEGKFVNDLCKPCFQFLTTGEGKYSQVYRNTVLKEREAIIQEIPGGYSVDPQWVCDMIRARSKA
jgi:hypothetical protein